jgi:hypothetical protein
MMTMGRDMSVVTDEDMLELDEATRCRRCSGTPKNHYYQHWRSGYW